MSRDGIAVPRLPGGAVHVWRAEVEGRAAAREVLGRVLAAYLGGGDEARTAIGEGGKPRLAEAPERLSFNLSHSEALALVAVAAGDHEVGVDVERLRPRRDLVRLAERWLPRPDAEAIASAPDPDRDATFYAAWTRHEARVKCTGTGLAGPPPPDDVVAWPVEVDDGYAAAVALRMAADDRGRRPEIMLRSVEELQAVER